MEASSNADGEDLAQCDEVAQVLDQRDEEIVRRAQKELEDKKEQLNIFRRSFRQRVVADTGGRQKSKRPKPLRQKPFPEGEIPQTTAKQYIPPGAYVWVGRAEGNWQGHSLPAL